MSNSAETGTKNNTGGVVNRADTSTRVEVLEIPGLNIPICFLQYLQAMNQASANSTEPGTASHGGVVVVQPTPITNFPKLCRDFADLDG